MNLVEIENREQLVYFLNKTNYNIDLSLINIFPIYFVIQSEDSKIVGGYRYDKIIVGKYSTFLEYIEMNNFNPKLVYNHIEKELVYSEY